MNLILAIPLPLRLVALFVIGVLVGRQLNRGIYRLAWYARSIGPWSPPPEAAPPRRASDRWPILGWWLLRRESGLHGRGYWIRPLLIELGTGIGFALLYWYKIAYREQQFLMDGLPMDQAAFHAQYLSHIVLISLMIVATFIDFDEQTIPDAITVPGAVLGLLLAAALPSSRLFAFTASPSGLALDQLHLASATDPLGRDWPLWLNGRYGLALGLFCFCAWWCAVLPWLWTMRRGWGKAFQYLAVSGRRGMSREMLALAGVGTAAILVTWWIGRERWESLLSALVGLAAGGGLIWAVRVLGSRALGQEAMGFGDVTLMSMIGAYTGWQPTLVIFFLAPFAALFVSVAQWLVTRRRDIAFGPYLCVATLYLLVDWRQIWSEFARPIFSLGWLVPAMVVVCLALMWALLTIMRFFRELLRS